MLEPPFGRAAEVSADGVSFCVDEATVRRIVQLINTPISRLGHRLIIHRCLGLPLRRFEKTLKQAEELSGKTKTVEVISPVCWKPNEPTTPSAHGIGLAP